MRKSKLKKIMVVSNAVIITVVLGVSAYGFNYVRKNYLSNDKKEVAKVTTSSKLKDDLIDPSKSDITVINPNTSSTEVTNGSGKSDTTNVASNTSTPTEKQNSTGSKSSTPTTSSSKPSSSNSGSSSGSTSTGSSNSGSVSVPTPPTSTPTPTTTPTEPTTPPSSGSSNNSPVYVVDIILESYNGYEYKLTAEQSKAIPQGENSTYENALANYLVNNYGKSYDTSLNSLAKLCYSDDSALKNNYSQYSAKYSSMKTEIFGGPFYYHPDIPLSKLVADHVKTMGVDDYKSIGVYAKIRKEDDGVFTVSGCIVYGNPR